MRCSKSDCTGALKVTHTYTTAREKYQRALCGRCSAVYRLTTTAAFALARGDGAKAHAARTKK